MTSMMHSDTHSLFGQLFMKACIVTHSVGKGDGQGRVNYEVVLETIRRGHHVTILASSIDPDLQQHPQITWVPISVKGLPTALLRQLFFSYKSAVWLRQHRHQFDVIQVNGSITSAPGDINAVHFVHSSWLKSLFHPVHQSRSYYGIYQGFYTRLNAYWEKQSFQQAQIVVAVSEKVKHELLTIGVPEQKTRVVLNGVDLQEFRLGGGDRSSLNLPKGVPLALFVGDIKSNRKNLDTVLHALVEVPELHLAVVGDTEGSPYPQLAAQLKLSTRVHFLGFRRDVPMIMQSADFFVLLSRYEPFGMVISEAMATGLPVITSANVGAADLVDADSGIVVPDLSDVTALARAMERLTSDAGLRQQMGQSARRVAERYGWSKMASQYVDLFESLCRSETVVGR